jgi:dGTPase
MVADLIGNSLEHPGGGVCLSAPVGEAITALRDWLFSHVYQAEPMLADFHKASHLLRELFAYFMSHPDELVVCGGHIAEGDSPEIAIADFVAGMTDRYAMNLYQQLFLPQPWKAL